MREILLLDGTPLASLRLSFRAGAALDPPGQPGVASLTAQMIASGGSARRSYKQIVDTLFPLGAAIGAMTDKELTTFAGDAHADHLAEFAALFAEVLVEPGWREDDFSRLRDEAANRLAVELRMQNDEELAKEALYQEIYAGHPYGWHNTGTLASLAAMTIEDLRAFHATHYTRANLVLGLGGGVSPAVAEALRAALAGLPAGTAGPWRPPPAPPCPHSTALLIEKPARSVAISCGFPIAVRRGHADYAALLTAVSCLGEHRTSSGRLFTRMRQLRGLNYGDYAYVEYFPEGMYRFEPSPNLARGEQIFQLWVRPVEPQQAVFALRLALYELERLVAEGISEEEFDRTRQYLSKHVYLLLKTRQEELGYAIDSACYGIGAYADYLRGALAGLTHEQVNAAARRHLGGQPRRIVMVAEDCASLRDQLLSGAPSLIEYNAPKAPELLEEDARVAIWPLALEPGQVRIVPATEIFA
jgi:zinc protease